MLRVSIADGVGAVWAALRAFFVAGMKHAVYGMSFSTGI